MGLIKKLFGRDESSLMDEFPEMSRYERLREETREYLLSAIKGMGFRTVKTDAGYALVNLDDPYDILLIE